MRVIPRSPRPSRRACGCLPMTGADIVISRSSFHRRRYRGRYRSSGHRASSEESATTVRRRRYCCSFAGALYNRSARGEDSEAPRGIQLKAALHRLLQLRLHRVPLECWIEDGVREDRAVLRRAAREGAMHRRADPHLRNCRWAPHEQRFDRDGLDRLLCPRAAFGRLTCAPAARSFLATADACDERWTWPWWASAREPARRVSVGDPGARAARMRGCLWSHRGERACCTSWMRAEAVGRTERGAVLVGSMDSILVPGSFGQRAPSGGKIATSSLPRKAGILGASAWGCRHRGHVRARRSRSEVRRPSSMPGSLSRGGGYHARKREDVEVRRNLQPPGAYPWVSRAREAGRGCGESYICKASARHRYTEQPSMTHLVRSGRLSARVAGQAARGDEWSCPAIRGSWYPSSARLPAPLFCGFVSAAAVLTSLKGGDSGALHARTHSVPHPERRHYPELYISLQRGSADGRGFHMKHPFSRHLRRRDDEGDGWTTAVEYLYLRRQSALRYYRVRVRCRPQKDCARFLEARIRLFGGYVDRGSHRGVRVRYDRAYTQRLWWTPCVDYSRGPPRFRYASYARAASSRHFPQLPKLDRLPDVLSVDLRR